MGWVKKSGRDFHRIEVLAQAQRKPMVRPHGRRDDGPRETEALQARLGNSADYDRWLCGQPGRVNDKTKPRGAAVRRREHGHALVQRDQQRPALAERRCVAGPVRSAVTGGRWLAHAARLTAWIHDVNPKWSEFCNNAPLAQLSLPVTNFPCHLDVSIL